MKPARVFTLLALGFAVCARAQDLPLFKAEAKSAFVWGDDTPTGATSSVVRDPLTGSEVLKLKHAEIEVSSQFAFERKSQQPEVFIAYTATIINNSSKSLAVRYGKSTIDGHLVSPLLVLPHPKKSHGKRAHVDHDAIDVAMLHCFSSGFLAKDNFFLPHDQSSNLMVEPKGSVTVSTVLKDPRQYPMLCSMEGCLPKGTVGYSIQVGSQEFIFIRPGRSLFNCGQ